jgi:WD40 repeat protein
VIAASRDFRLGVVHDAKEIGVHNFDTGELIRDLRIYGYGVENAIASKDGGYVLLSHGQSKSDSNKANLYLWTNNDVVPQAIDIPAGDASVVCDFSPDADKVLTGNDKGEVVLYSMKGGTEKRRFSVVGMKDIASCSLSPNGELMLLIGMSNSERNIALLLRSRDARTLLTFGQQSDGDEFVTDSTFSSDGKLFAVGYSSGAAEVWSTKTLSQVRSLAVDKDNADQVMSLAFSNDGRFLVSGTRDFGAFMWSVETGRLIHTFEVDSIAGHVHVSSVAVSRDGKLVAGGLAEHARSSGDIGAETSIKVWDVNTGKVRFTLRGHEGGVRAVAFSSDRKWLISASYDGTIRYWDPSSGKEVAAFASAEDGRWLIVTERGFFAGSRGSDDLINVVRGLEAFSTSQFRDHLYRPDLVEELLKGDPEGKYSDAASKLDLQKILDSGPAPQIELLEKRTEQSADTVRLAVRIMDTGGGIGGKVVWRVNGKTQGDLSAAGLQGAPDPGRAFVMTQGLKVEAGQSNMVEVTAYNGVDLLASLPFKITVDPFGVTTQERPRLYILAIGVEKYAMKEYELHYAVKDAKDFGDALKTVGHSLFSDVKVMPLYDSEVTKTGLEAAITKLSTEIKPTDVFVLFLGGHGRSIAGKYYFVQEDLDFSKGQSIEHDGISQDLWQTWLAKIPAQKTLLVFDTCESAAAAGLVRGGERERQTAMEQLQNATGQNLIAAARQAAQEGYKGHGVLTYTILSAFQKPEASTANDRIDVDGLALYVGEKVPEITKRLYGFTQEPIRKLTGNNFPLGLRVIDAPEPSECPDKQEFIVIRNERLRQKPEESAGGDRILDVGYQVGAKFVGGWALLCRDGVKLGYVPLDALVRPR